MLHRRQLLTGLAALALPSCRRDAGGPAAPPDPAWRELAFEPSADSPDPQRALLFAPPGAATLPVLVALHGRGEAVRGLEIGARGWRDDYHIDQLLRRLSAPPLTDADLRGFSDPARLARLNASLARDPWRGLAIVTPYTPDLADRSAEGARPFARFLVERLLPRVRAEAGCAAPREATGIDGVSLGGRLALLVGLTCSEAFGAVGALQPAIRREEAPRIAELARRAAQQRPLRLRLVSSERDPFLPAVEALGDALAQAGVAHEVVITPGPHDYAWNRGPGGAEMLLWHERVLRGLAPP